MARKLFITVHGVGDQRQFDTVQQAAIQIIRTATGAAGPRISLGMFSSGVPKGSKPPPTAHATYWFPHQSGNLGFSEIYWADLSRDVDLKGFRLEEGIPWAQTLVDRVKARKAMLDQAKANLAKQPGTTPPPTQTRHPDPDYELIRTVIGEMGDGLQLLDWLTSLAPKLKLPTFNLSKIVNAYLGDVQLMAEFKDVRDNILERFRETVDQVTKNLKGDDEIYFITHSEGTVVTLLGLMIAMADGQKPAWLDRVRGWMTIGSPIDKHLVVWPELWIDFEKGPTHIPSEDKRIKWWNYSDWGDPIGFRLETMRQWMRDSHAANSNTWAQAFQFEEKPTPLTNGTYNEDPSNVWDLAYSRYPWPGQAHLDYWSDNDLFDHFLSHTAGMGTKKPPLKMKVLEKIWSYVVPYLLALIVLASGVFFLNSGIWGAQGLKREGDALINFTREVLALTCLIAGTTVLARMPRIVKEKIRFTWLGLGVFSLFACAFVMIFPQQTIVFLANKFQLPVVNWFPIVAVVLAAIVGVNALLLRIPLWQFLMMVVCLVMLTLLFVAGAAWLLSRQLPGHWNFVKGDVRQWLGLWLTAVCLFTTLLWTVREKRAGHSAGLWPLVGPGYTAIVGIGCALAIMQTSKGAEKPELWPFFLGAVAFLFLWRLAAILFDLTFIWHRYIKQNVLPTWVRNNLAILPGMSCVP